MNKIILSLILALFTLTSLFLGYFYINKNDDNLSTIAQNKNIKAYQIAKPKYGNFIDTIKTEAIFNDNQDIGMATIDSSSLNDLKIGQDIILRNTNDVILPLAGKVKAIRKNALGADILFTLPDQTDTAQLSSAIEIISFESNGLKLIPTSALQKDLERQDIFVWTVNKTNIDKKSPAILNKINISTPYKNDTVFAASDNNDIFYIINPDDKIALNSNNLDFQIVDISTPNYNPIYNAWVEYNAAKLGQIIDGIQVNIDACGKPKNGEEAPPTADGDSCSDEQSTIISAEDIFLNIQNMKDGNTNAQNACGDAPADGSCN